jgi:hypothetical protein
MSNAKKVRGATVNIEKMPAKPIPINLKQEHIFGIFIIISGVFLTGIGLYISYDEWPF